MKQILLLASLTLLATSLFAESTNASTFELKKSDFNGFPNTLKGRDFFYQVIAPQHATESTQPDRSCRENIAKVVCLVDPAPEGQDPNQRVCLSGGESYAIYFERLYDNYPPAFQKMFCSLKHLFIEKKFFGSAYAGTLKDQDGKVNGAIMGIRKSLLDENLNLKTWASWKEQLSFGGIADSYTLTPDLPSIETASLGDASDFLYFVTTHEFGHIFDFANGLNKIQNCVESQNKDEDPECEFAEGSWGSISWNTSRKAKPENDFANRSALCFYMCNGKTLHRNDVSQIYEDFSKSDFISTYASTEAWDDLADSLAYYLTAQNLNTTYAINTQTGNSYDIMAKLRSPLFAKKYEYIDNFLKRTDIVYP